MNVRCASLWTDFAPDTYTHSRPRYGQFPRVLFIAQVFLLLREREKKKVAPIVRPRGKWLSLNNQCIKSV
jgi:hypothetical protein